MREAGPALPALPVPRTWPAGRVSCPDPTQPGPAWPLPCPAALSPAFPGLASLAGGPPRTPARPGPTPLPIPVGPTGSVRQ